MQSRLIIVQPYVPTYRREFFVQLISALETDGIRCSVLAGRPEAAQSLRGDAISAPWIDEARPRRIRLGSRQVEVGGVAKHWSSADALIVGLVGSSITTYQAVCESIQSKKRVGLWGHVRNYVAPGNSLDMALERWQMRHSDHVFSYTPGGAAEAAASGVPNHAITSVMNTIDTRSLESSVAALKDEEIDTFLTHHGLHDGPIFAYIGGLDESKRVDFLAAALDAMWERDPSARVLIGGRGKQELLLKSAQDRGQAILLGHVDDHTKALLGRISIAILCPGRIGLVAVEALLLGLPIATTPWPFHAPEVEYLVEGESRLTGPDDPAAYAEFVLQIRAREERRAWSYPHLSDMVDNYRKGVLSMLG